MPANDALFVLIKSLNKAEKRFFKVFSSRHILGDDNKYLLLFDAIDKQKVYDEQALKKQFAAYKFSQRLSPLKSYLYDMILKSMSVYFTTHSIDAQLLEDVKQICFLYEKNLLEQVQKKLKSAYKIALANERLSILPELFYWQKKIMEAGFYTRHSLDDIADIYGKAKKYIQKLNTINEYWQLEAKLYFQYNHEGVIRNRTELHKIEDVLQSNLMKNENKADSFEAELLYNKIYATYFFVLRDFSSCYAYIKKVVDLLESKPEMMQVRPVQYVQAISNLLNMSRALQKNEETSHYLQQLKNLLQDKKFPRSERVMIKLFEAYYYHQLNYLQDSGNLSESSQYMKEVVEGLERYNGKIDKMGEVMLRFHLVKICIQRKNYAEALAWLRKILDNETPDYRHDIYGFSHVLYILLLLESSANNKTLLSALQQNLYYFRMRNPQYQFDACIVLFLENLLNSKLQNEDIQAAYLQLYQELQELSQDPFERKAFAYFDFLSWIEAQMQPLSATKAH
ncbi:MAG: hypothetical protein R2798_09005 [Chitinophagales bacterium]|nr:hypothetical protein [Bacteroidota bacterium]MCB9043909.1 hypothetical protein [Chitinophagales bacterium]